MTDKMIKGPSVRGPGHDELWLWFGLSRASFLVLPRVLMHEMPDDWQMRMAQLLQEYDERFPNIPDRGVRVQVTDRKGQLVKTPEWLVNYRHPDKEIIDQVKK